MIDPELLQSMRDKDLDRFKRRLADPDVDVNGMSITQIRGGRVTILVEILKKLADDGEPFDEITLEMLKELVKHPKLDVNKRGTYGFHPLKFVNHPKILKILLTHPDLDVNGSPSYDTDFSYFSDHLKDKEIIKLLLEDGRVDPSVGNQFWISWYLETPKPNFADDELRTLLKNYKYVTPSTYKRMASEVATMSGTNTTSNVQSRTLPQLPLGVSTNINRFLNKPNPNPPRISEETKRYQERIAREKEAAEQKQQADKDYRAREGILAARDSFPADPDPDPTAFKGTNPRNLGGRKTKSSNTKRGGRKTRRKPISARYSRSVKVRSW